MNTAEVIAVISDQKAIIKELREEIDLDKALKESMERIIFTMQTEIDYLKLQLDNIKPESSLTDIINKFTDANVELEVKLRRTTFDMLCKNHNLRKKLILAKDELFRCHRAGANCDSKEHSDPSIDNEEVKWQKA